MGMYTGLRFKAIIKEEYYNDIEILLKNGEWSNCKHDFLIEFGDYSRSSFIPFGTSLYMPDEWERENYIATDGFCRSFDRINFQCSLKNYEETIEHFLNNIATDGFCRSFDRKTGYLTFQCSLKNYEETIEYFLNNIATRIVKKVIFIEKFYEEWSHSITYDIIDGQLVDRHLGIIYDNDYDNDDDILERDSCITYDCFKKNIMQSDLSKYWEDNYKE